jgi:hypothetical protein
MRYFLLAFLLSAKFSMGQTNDCNCETDLAFVIESVKDAPSFKSQLKDDDYHKQFINELKETIKSDVNIELNCIAYLQKYIKLVKDNHLYISDGNTEKDNTSFFPIEDNLEALKKSATTGSEDELTGIYNLLNTYKVAVIKDATNTYKGVLLETTNDKWRVGQTKFTINKTPNGLEGIFYNGILQPQYSKIEYQNGRLFPEQWIKEDKKDLYTFNPYDMPDERFQYKKLANGTHYVRLGSFSGNNSVHSEAKNLVLTMEKEITSGNVIIDLRNNGGGGPRTSDLFRKFFKKTKNDLKLYVIQNNYCGSDCEQFLMKLKGQQTVKTFGEPTNGAIAYGFGNYSSPSLKTPCNGFSLGVTTSKYEKYLQYEVVGIPPDVTLNTQDDWIQQVLKTVGN